MFAKARGRRQGWERRPLAVEMLESRHLLSRLIQVRALRPVRREHGRRRRRAAGDQLPRQPG